MARYGDVNYVRFRRKTSVEEMDYHVKDGVGYLPLNNGNYAMVDLDVFERCRHRVWSSSTPSAKHRTSYAYNNVAGVPTYLHREIMGFPVGLDVDHINGNGLDNRRSNLRAIPHYHNVRSGYARKDCGSGLRGVRKVGDRWCAKIRTDGRSFHLGMFGTKEEAAQMYIRAKRIVDYMISKINKS